MIINKKIIRTMKEHKSQYLGSILLILISCTMFTLFNIAGINIIKNLENFKEINVQEDANFILSEEIDNINSLEEDFDVIIEKRNAFDYSFKDDVTLRILSESKNVNKMEVIEGNKIKKASEILLDPGFAKANNLKINEKIKIFNKNYIIKGFAVAPDYIYPLKTENDMIKNSNTFGIAVMTKEAFEDLDKGYIFYSIKFNNIDNKENFKRELEVKNNIIKWINRDDNMRINFIEGDIKGIEPMGKILPLVILLLTNILLSVIFWRLIKNEYYQIGILYSLGYRKIEILRHYILYPIIISLIGSFIGTLLGVLAIKPFIEFTSTFYNLPVLDIDYKIYYLIISLLLPFIFLVPTTFFIVLKSLKYEPLLLLKGIVTSSKLNFIEKKLKLDKFHFNLKFKIREIIRNIPRAILMILGITLASSLLLLGFAIKDSMNLMMNKNFDNTYKYKYSYMFNELQTESIKDNERATLAPVIIYKNSENVDAIIYGIEENSKLINLVDKENNKISPTNTIISKALSEGMNLKEGDTIKIKNKNSLKTYNIKIDKIAEFYLGNYIYVPLNKFNELNEFPKDSYLEIYSKSELDIPEDKLISKINKSDLIDGFKKIMEPMNYMISGIAGLSFLIGLIIVYIITSLIIEENKKTISILKILGYNKKQLYKLILNVNTIFVIIGFIISIPIVYVATDLFFEFMTEEMNMKFPVILNKINILITFLAIFMTYEISKFLNRKKIVGISMADSLKSKME